jgi:hypothetical protein
MDSQALSLLLKGLTDISSKLEDLIASLTTLAAKPFLARGADNATRLFIRHP